MDDLTNAVKFSRKAGTWALSNAGIERKGRTQDLVAITLAQVTPKLDESADQVGLGKDEIDREHHVEPRHDLVDACTQLVGVACDLFVRRIEQVGNGNGYQKPIDGLLGTVLAQQAQERQPLFPIGVVSGVPARGVQQNA